MKNQVSPDEKNNATENLQQLKLIRPVKYQEIEFICKELVILLINQEISLESGTKIFENRINEEGLLTCQNISEALQM